MTKVDRLGMSGALGMRQRMLAATVRVGERDALMRGMDTSQRTLDRDEAESPISMSFGEQVVEALGEYVDAKLDYAETRRGPAAEYANPDHVDKAGMRLQALLDKVKFAL